MNMIHHINLTDVILRSKIKTQEIILAGNIKLHIYGKLNCTSGKRMKKENRVFFTSEKEALEAHFRPCGHCLKSAYQKWKDGSL